MQDPGTTFGRQVQGQAAEPGWSFGDGESFARSEFRLVDTLEEPQRRSVFESQHMPEEQHAFGAGPIVGHIADIAAGERPTNRLFLSPAKQRSGVIEKASERVESKPAGASP